MKRARALAKRSYMLAAETLLKLAKHSSPRLKEARVARAKRLVEIAEGIDAAVVRKTFPAGGENEGEDEKDGEGREWTAAEVPNVHFSDIAGLDDVKKAITTRMINPVKYPEKYKLYNKKSGGGVLLFGPARDGQDDDSQGHRLRSRGKVLRRKGFRCGQQVGGRV